MVDTRSYPRMAGGIAAETASPLDKYQLRLPSFEGPLDVLLRLIERNQLPITEVSLVSVTDQFLDYIAARHVLPSSLADFATTGSRLVLLKSRSLLPRPPAAEEEEEGSDLVKELIAYQAVKEAASRLGTLDMSGSGAFAHRPEAVAAPPGREAPPLARHQPRSLVSALRRRLSAAAIAPARMPVRPVVTLREIAERILSHLTTTPTLALSTVLSPDADRQEVLTAFQALLALVRRQTVIAEQEGLFSEILIQAAAPVTEMRMADPADGAAV